MNSNYIFRRVEKKYLLDSKQKKLLFDSISQYLERDQYFESTICSIYFDTENNDLIINSIEKPIYKDKVRLRSYGIPSKNDDVFLEIKNKYKGVVGKRRIRLKLKDFYDYLDNRLFNKDEQIMKEIDYLFQYYKLKSNMFIAYDRKSYKGREDSNLRITVDSNLRSRKDNLRLELGDQGDNFFDDDYSIMEIKTLGSIPLWLVKNLSDLKIYPASFTKYGNVYKKYIGSVM